MKSLRRKISLSFGGVCLLFSIIYTLVYGYRTSTVIQNQAMEDTALMSEQFLINLNGHTTEDSSYLQELTRKYKNSSISYIGIRNKDYKYVASTIDSETGSQKKDQYAEKVFSTGETASYKINDKDKGLMLQSVMAIKNDDKVVGVIELGIPMSNSQKDISNLIISMLVIAIVIQIVAFIIGGFVARSIVNPIKHMLGSLDRVAKGDFTASVRVSSKDEIGKLSNIMADTLEHIKEMILEIKASANNLAEASQGVAASSEQMASSNGSIAEAMTDSAHRVNTQSHNLDESYEVLIELEERLKTMESNLSSALSGNMEIKHKADDGKDKIVELAKSIEEIRYKFEEVENTLSKLNVSVDNISSITLVINDVAEQTNLLALNAAIEAARVGEQGRGFAVVADEIRTLAEQVLDSSKNINNIVTGITGDTKEVSNSAKEVSFKISEQGKILGDTIESFKNIVSGILDNSTTIENSNTELKETLNAKNNVKNRIEIVTEEAKNISESTISVASNIEEQTATVQEFTATAQTLDSMAASLTTLVNRFKIE